MKLIGQIKLKDGLRNNSILSINNYRFYWQYTMKNFRLAGYLFFITIISAQPEVKINNLQKRHHDLLGNTAYYSVMSDWNPAEMIGLKPKPLALSLYIWLIRKLSKKYNDLFNEPAIKYFFVIAFVILVVRIIFFSVEMS